MGTPLKEQNNAEVALTVGSLTVMQDINNAGLKTIRNAVNELENSNQKLVSQVQATQDYWSELSEDGNITPIEKQTLRKEWNNIQQSYNLIWQSGVNKQVEHTDTFQAFRASFLALQTYLLTTLNLFGDMSESTTIGDRTTFNLKYATYYNNQFKAESLIAAGTASGYQDYEFAIGTKDTHPAESSKSWQDSPPEQKPGEFLWARTAWVNSEEIRGSWCYFRLTGEAAADVMAQWSINGSTWHTTYVLGDLYVRYSYDGGNTWSDKVKAVGESNSSLGYIGYYNSFNSLPVPTDMTSFLASETFHQNHIVVTKTGKELRANGLRILTQRTFLAGYVYVYKNRVWKCIWDKDSSFYIEAYNDLVKLGFPISPTLQAEYDRIKAEAVAEAAAASEAAIKKESDKIKAELEQELSELGFNYKGPIKDWTLVDKSKASYGDFYLYLGSTTSKYTFGNCYYWNKSDFVIVDPSSTENYTLFMEVLYDLMTETKNYTDDQIEALSANFGVKFCKTLVAWNAFIRTLCTQKIELQTNGVISSKDFNSETSTTGFVLDSNGNAIFKGDTCKFGGSLEAAKGTFSGSLSAASGSFKGNITGSTGTFGAVDSNGNVPSDKTLTVNGAIVVNGDMTVNGNATLGDGTTFSGTLDGADGSFGGVNSDGNMEVKSGKTITVAGDLKVTGKADIAGEVTIGTEETPANGYFSGTIHASEGEISGSLKADSIEIKDCKITGGTFGVGTLSVTKDNKGVIVTYNSSTTLKAATQNLSDKGFAKNTEIAVNSNFSYGQFKENASTYGIPISKIKYNTGINRYLKGYSSDMGEWLDFKGSDLLRWEYIHIDTSSNNGYAIFMDLPTVDPHNVGQLYKSGGYVKISEG